MSIQSLARRLHRLGNHFFGIDLRRAATSVAALPRYIRDYRHFRAGYAGPISLWPCLHDWGQEGGDTKSEYFWQDLLVAQRVFAANPRKHVDIGSRVDGFVAHVASFREIEVFDVRPVTSVIPGVSFVQANLMDAVKEYDSYCDSLSCLHALEHFGLGRYGDPVDPSGFERGLSMMARFLGPNGTFYLSVPLGLERVEFNAHRVSDPRKIIEIASGNSLQLTELTTIGATGTIQPVALDFEPVSVLGKEPYILGLFVFKKAAGGRNNP